ncbi:MAG: hypothetical protein BAJALOKI1v1_80036 [Promethearchaeota archaeon]|nr:MAG: hypothetical protein BAJALOKI1v1_80036 [Candidatus Lokiarchaeota archaeon]
MTDIHEIAFWEDKTALILRSSSRTLPYIFFTSIRKKENGEWEKPSKKEGKVIKIDLKEIICLLEVLQQELEEWRGYHIYKQESTEIYSHWQDKSKTVFVFEIGDYEINLKFPDTKLLALLLDHILLEKIEYATSGSTESKILNDD